MSSVCTSLTLFVIFFAATAVRADEPILAAAQQVMSKFCLDCHAGEDAESNVRLDAKAIDWTQSTAPDYWERVYDVVRSGEMPPKDADQPTPAERETISNWLHQRLAEHDPVGGTVPRRLNREEYENTIRDLFDLTDFTVPDAFPADDSSHGFDNVGTGLVLSPPLMAQYLAVATHVADEVLPTEQQNVKAQPKLYDIDVDEIGSYRQAGVTQMDGKYRLASSRNMASSAGWPKLFESRESGVYKISVDASAFQTDKMFYKRRTKPLRLSLYAKQKTEQMYAPFGEVRKLADFDVLPDSKEPQTFECEAKLFRGETFGLRWANGPAYSDPPVREFSIKFLSDRLKRDRELYAAMLQFKSGRRGISQPEYYAGIRKIIDAGKLDLKDPQLDKMPEHYGGGIGEGPHNWVKSYVHEELLRFGPALDILAVSAEGPLRLIEDDETRARRARKKQFLGQRKPNSNDEQFIRNVLSRFLGQAFRRPVTDAELNSYAKVAIAESRAASERGEAQPNRAGLHLALRRTLVSPKFLYRCLDSGELDQYGIASRLSYFLTSSPPDEQLILLADKGRMNDPAVLRRETIRLIESKGSEKFIRSFTGQWLGTRVLKDIMPDPRLLPFFDADRDALISETELFVGEILRENHSLETFIDPDFSYRSSHHNKIYGGDLQGHLPRRVTFEKGGRHGGILGLASVLMATANGVDTHPVHRGVWLLENVFGTPTPSPPDDIPAIAPDTSGTQTIRAQLEAHRSDESCARCHRQIDPLGMVMENYDPVGRWRDHYPIYAKPKDGEEKLDEEFYSTIGKGTKNGPKIESQSVLPNGQRLEDAVDLKRYVLTQMDQFTHCLAEKLLIYSTGRKLSFGDRDVLEGIVDDTNAGEMGFQDLIVSVVQSESFRTK